jgi:hypothetical protein
MILRVSQSLAACLNGKTPSLLYIDLAAMINKSMQVQSFPLPSVSEILHWIAARSFRVTLDCRKGYHNFEIAPASRWITRTIGSGLAYQWRKCVQGIASTCAFFQWAMSTLLSDFLFKSCVIYLDDIFVCGGSPQECQLNTMEILRVLNDHGIRLNFAKCNFVPSTDVKVLGCIVKGLVVHPSPTIQNTVSLIVHPNSQTLPKKKFASLHHFLGLCAYLDSNCPGMKTALSPLYSAVSAPIWNWTPLEEAAYAAALRCLNDLKPYALPSYSADSMLELHTDASDEAWSAVLWERRPDDAADRSSKNFHLLAMYGGVFNARQYKWQTLLKEMFALKEGLERSDHFIRVAHVRCIVDIKVLTFCSISKNPVMQRWHAYIQRYQLSFIHVSSATNSAADALSRLQHCFLPSKPALALHPTRMTVAPINPIVISSDSSFGSPADSTVSIVTRNGLATTPVPPGRAARRRTEASPPQPAAITSPPPTPQRGGGAAAADSSPPAHLRRKHRPARFSHNCGP